MLNTVFLDLDDTLLDFRRAESRSLTRTLELAGVTVTPDIVARYHAINAAHWRLLEEGRLTRAQVLTHRFEQLFEELGLSCSIREICTCYEGSLAESSFLLPGAVELLKALSSRYRLYLATNGTARIQHRRLDLSGIRPYFTAIFISEEMGVNKPSPAYFHACFDTIPNFDPAAAIIVGDSLTSDIRGGRDAGLRTCWFCLDTAAGKKAAAAHPDIVPDYIICSLEELPPLLESLAEKD